MTTSHSLDPPRGTTPQADRPGDARYQRERLRLGIVGIGLLVLAAPALAATESGRAAAEAVAQGPAPVAGALAAAALAALAAVVLLPVDLAGARIERRFGMGGTDRWWPAYLTGTLAWIAALACGGMLTGVAALSGPAWWAVAAAGIAAAMLVGALVTDTLAVRTADPATPAEREAIERSLRPLGEAAPEVAFTGDDGRALDGGWAGSTLLLSRSCRPLVGEKELACLIIRELAHRRRRDRLRGVLLGTAWAAAAAPLTHLVWSPDPSQTGVLVLTLAATATVWSWVGLLVLPGLGRRQVLAADRAYMEAGGDPTVLRGTILLLAERNRGNRTLPVWVERIFHPVPSVATRLAAIDAGGSR